MAPDRPGYDIESTEPEAGMVRRIEVRGMQGAYKEDASVLLSNGQGRDALRNESSKIQCRLYVVDCMDTEAPNVHPVSWTENHLRFGLYASVWANVDKRWRDTRHGRHCYPSRCCMSGGPYEIAGGVGPVAHLRNRTIHAGVPHPAAIIAGLRIDRFQPLVAVQRTHFVVPSIGRRRSCARIMRSRREYLRAPRLRAACARAERMRARRIRVTVGNMLAAARPAAQHIPYAHAKPAPGCTEFEQFLPGIAFPYGALADMFEPEPPPAVPRPNFGLQRLHTRIASGTSPYIRCRRRLWRPPSSSCGAAAAAQPRRNASSHTCRRTWRQATTPASGAPRGRSLAIVHS